MGELAVVEWREEEHIQKEEKLVDNGGAQKTRSRSTKQKRGERRCDFKARRRICANAVPDSGQAIFVIRVGFRLNDAGARKKDDESQATEKHSCDRLVLESMREHART